MVEEILGGRTGFSSQPITMTGDNAIRFRNASHYIASLNENYLDIDAPSGVRFGTALDLSANDISLSGDINTTGDINTVNLIAFGGSSGARFLTGADELAVQMHDGSDNYRTRMKLLGNAAVGSAGITFYEPLDTDGNSIVLGGGYVALESGFLHADSNSASSGYIRLPNAGGIVWRNKDGNGDIELTIDASDVLVVNTTLGLGGQDLTDLGMLNYDAETELTISSGTVAATQTVNRIDTENDDPSDDLDTVTGGTIGDILIFRPASASRTVVVQDGGGANGFRLNGSVNFTMDNVYDILQCIFTPNSEWQEISRSVA